VRKLLIFIIVIFILFHFILISFYFILNFTFIAGIQMRMSTILTKEYELIHDI